MTETNKRLREKIREIEILATRCLHSQPDDDMACEVHMRKTLADIADLSGEHRGGVKVLAYDIKWDTDGEKADLPDSLQMILVPDEDLGDMVVDELSDRFGFCVKSCKYRMM